MTRHFICPRLLTLRKVGVRLQALQTDVVGCTAITPAIYQDERLLQLAKEVRPRTVTVLGGIHGTFMYPPVLKEAPWIDAVVRGEGEQVFLNFFRAVDDGAWARDRHATRGVAFLDTGADGGNVVATPAEPPFADLDRTLPDWVILEWDNYIYIPLGVRVAIPNFARGLPEKVQWGINTRVTDILRDEKLLPMFRQAGLVTEAKFIAAWRTRPPKR